MAKPGFTKHPKFVRLVRLLGEPAPHVLGYLEFLWSVAYELAGGPVGDSVDVELAAQYPGDEGTLTTALLRVRLIDDLGDGRYAVHDLLDHAPGYVVRRAGKAGEASRDKWCDRCGELYHSGERHSRFCSDTCRKMAHKQASRVTEVTHSDGAGSSLVTKVTNGDAVPSTAQHSTAQHSTKDKDVCPEMASPSSGPTSANAVKEEKEKPQKDQSEVLLVFPCDGKTTRWPLTVAQVERWKAVYPSLDVLGEARKALAWIEANPKRRKTHGGMQTFLVNWLNRTQDRGGSRREAEQTGQQSGNGVADPVGETIKRVRERFLKQQEGAS